MSRILVLETTGCLTYGIVARSGFNGSLVCSAPAMSSAADFTTAVGQVLEQLRSQTKTRLPKTAVLITPSAVSDLLVLPVDPRNPRSRQQMNELVRWEFEEVYVRQSDMWSLGALLQGKGYVSQQQRHALETDATSGQRRVSLADAYRSTVTKEQFEECLAMQELLMAMDDELLLGWIAQSNTPEDGRYAWYCAGTGDQLRSQWVKALEKHNITCSWIYPQLGACLPLVDDQPQGLLVDIRQEQFGMFQLTNGHLNSVSTEPCLHGMAEPNAVALSVAKFINPDTQVIHLSAPSDQLESIADALKLSLATVQIKNISITDSLAKDQDCPRPVLASLEGVARHALKLCRPNALVKIEGHPPRPAMWKNRQLWPWAIIVLLIVAAVGIETYTRVQTRVAKVALEDLDIEFDYRLRIQNEAREMRSQIQRLEKQYADKQLELDQLLHRADILNNVVISRQKSVPGVLQAIGNAVVDGVVLDLLEESKDRANFYLEGWSLKDTQGQQFAKRLNENLARWKYEVGSFELSRGKGRYGIDGFNLKIRLVKKNTTVDGGQR